MRDLKKLENELRFAADAGCDYTLLLEAADALAEAKKVIDTLANGNKNGKTVYLQMRYWCDWKELKNLQNYLNRKSPDKIVVLPTQVKLLNPEELETVKREIQGV